MASTAACGDSQPIAVRILEIAFPSGKALLVDRDSELLGNGVDVVHVEVNERARGSITQVLRQIDLNRSAAHSYDHGKPGSN